MRIEAAGHEVYAYTGSRAFDAALPTVVFVHGAAQDHSVWALQSRYFAHHGANVLAIDLPGHGRSGGDALQSVPAIADWLVALLDAVGVSAAALVGHSMGSLAALDAAGRYPERVSKLALLGTAAPMAVADVLLSAARADDHLAYELITGWSYAEQRKLGGNPQPGMWMTGSGLRLMERTRPGVLYADLRACHDYAGGLAAAAAVRCPVLLLAGQRDLMAPPKGAQALIAALGDRRVITIPSCGHSLMTEAPDTVLDALRDFLASPPLAAKATGAGGAKAKMRLTVHENAAAFVAAANALLSSAEAEYSIVAGPAARMVSAPNDDDAGSYLATVSAGDEVVAAALLGVSGGLVLTAAPDAATSLIAADLAGRGRKPKGVVGPLASCEGFARAWRERTGQAHVLRFHLRHFELTDAPSLPAARGALRPPAAGEGALLVGWELAFAGEAGLPDPAEQVRRTVERRIARGNVRVWDDGGAVAYCGFGKGAAQTARIGPVYTPPEFRGRRYASALVAHMAHELLATGMRAIFLTTDVANPTSNGIYRRIGFRPVADHYHFDLIGPTA